MASLPSFVLNGWRLHQGEEGRARVADQLNHFTTSSLAETFMTFQLDKAFAPPNRSGSAPSLASIAAGKVLESLQNSGDLAADVKTIAENLDSITLRQLLNHPRTPYQLLRTFLNLPQTLEAEDRRCVDVDEAVLHNEHYIRSRDSNGDGKYLVSLEDLSQTLVKDSQNSSHLSFTRKDPPKGGLEVLDQLRKTELTIQPNSACYCKVFERVTHGILRGLDWNNVLVAGGMALTTLLHTDPSKDDDKEVRDPDIDLYIYGLGPEDANRKIEEVHDTWDRNLPATAQPRLVVKNAKTITLLSSYPHRRIQIVLKLLPSPTDVLLNFDLDACAMVRTFPIYFSILGNKLRSSTTSSRISAAITPCSASNLGPQDKLLKETPPPPPSQLVSSIHATALDLSNTDTEMYAGVRRVPCHNAATVCASY